MHYETIISEILRYLACGVSKLLKKMLDHNTLLAIGFSLGCGVCIGWIFKSRAFKGVATATKLSESVVGTSGETKLVLVVRNDLKMGKGKIAAQCAHAAVVSYEQLLRINPALLKQWRLSGQPKIVTKVESEDQILQITKEARELGLTAGMVKDAGRTQIAPGTLTVVGVGPGPVDLVDKVTGHLKLL